MFLLFDCDGVMADWHGGFTEFATERGFHIDPSHLKDTYAMYDWFTDMSKEQFSELVREFNTSPERIMHMKPLQDAVRGIKELAKDSRFRLGVLTACGDCEDSVSTRKKMIQSLFPDCFQEGEIHVIVLGECKSAYLKDLRPDFFVEDSVTHARTAVGMDIPTILIQHTYNGGEEGIPYVDNYEQMWLDLSSVFQALVIGSWFKPSHDYVAGNVQAMLERVRYMG